MRRNKKRKKRKNVKFRNLRNSFFSFCRLFNEFGNSSRRCGRNFQRNEKVIYYDLFWFVSIQIMIFKIFLDDIQCILYFYLFLLFFSYSNIQIVDFFLFIFDHILLLYVFHFKIFDVTYILFPHLHLFDFFFTILALSSTFFLIFISFCILLFENLFIYLFVYLFIYLFIYLCVIFIFLFSTFHQGGILSW